MKMKSLFLAALAVIGAFGAFAAKDEPGNTGLAVVPVKGSEVYRVIYKGESVGKVKLNIYNSKSTLIFSEAIHATSGFILPVNFSGLTQGDYTIEIVDASGKKVEKVAYQPGKTIKSIHVARISGGENKFILSIANSGKQYISLKIYNKENTLIYAENTSITGDFAKIYKLGALSSSYTFEVTDTAGNTKTIKF